MQISCASKYRFSSGRHSNTILPRLNLLRQRLPESLRRAKSSGRGCAGPRDRRREPRYGVERLKLRAQQFLLRLATRRINPFSYGNDQAGSDETPHVVLLRQIILSPRKRHQVMGEIHRRIAHGASAFDRRRESDCSDGGSDCKSREESYIFPMKINLTRWQKALGTGLLLGSMAVFTTSCVVREQVGYSSAPYGPYYDYYYYPDCDVYFYPASGVYFWFYGGRWCSGHRLPSSIVIHESARQSVRLHSSRPWMEHGPAGHGRPMMHGR